MAPCGVRVLLAVCAIAALIVETTSSTVSRGRRADDGGPLEVVVEQLSQQVNSLSAQLTQQAASFNSQLTQQAASFHSQLDTVNAELVALKAKTGQDIL